MKDSKGKGDMCTSFQPNHTVSLFFPLPLGGHQELICLRSAELASSGQRWRPAKNKQAGRIKGLTWKLTGLIRFGISWLLGDSNWNDFGKEVLLQWLGWPRRWTLKKSYIIGFWCDKSIISNPFDGLILVYSLIANIICTRFYFSPYLSKIQLLFFFVAIIINYHPFRQHLSPIAFGSVACEHWDWDLHKSLTVVLESVVRGQVSHACDTDQAPMGERRELLFLLLPYKCLRPSSKHAPRPSPSQ